MTAVATTTWLCERDGNRLGVTIEIGSPYQCGPEEWACSVALNGLHDKLRDIRGGDALQALCLALRLAFSLLMPSRTTADKFCIQMVRRFRLSRIYLAWSDSTSVL